VLVVAVGNTLNGSTGQPLVSGQANGTFRANGASGPGLINAPLTVAVDPNGTSFYGGSSISGFVMQSALNGGSSAATETSYPGAQATTYGFAQPALPTTVPSGVGAARTSQTQTGYFGGIMQPFTASGAGSPYAVTGTANVTTDATNYQVAANFAGRDPLTASSSGINSLGVQFGSTAPGITRGRQAYIDDSHFAALESPLSPSQVNGAPLIPNGDPLQGAHVYLVTGATVPSPTLFPNGGVPCQCQFLQWGYWGGQLNTGTATGSDPTRVDLAHINTWVAGIPTAVSDIQSLQANYFMGTYTGSAAGSVFNNGAHYLASGGVTGTFNFGVQSASINITNFDGQNFFLRGSLTPNSANYSLFLSSSTLFGPLKGTFFGPMAAETGGNFAFSGSNYFTSGIFAAKR